MNSYRNWEFLCQLSKCPLSAPLGLLVGYSCFVVEGLPPMFEELWSEIADAPGEIFDVIEYKEEWEKDEKFNVESYINSNIDY